MAGDIEQGESGGLSRRQMIKASAVAGAAAWTAPMIIDSLSSPAAAGSGGGLPTGCSYALIVFTYGGSTYVMKIALGSSDCAGDNTTSPDSPYTGDVCNTHTYGNPSAVLQNESGDLTPYPGGISACNAIFTVSTTTVSADVAGVCIIYAVSHHGGGGGIGTKSHFFPVCPPAGTCATSINLNCNP